MRLSCDYNTLVSSLSLVSGVVEDALVQEDSKNIIFQLSEKNDTKVVKIIGATSQLIYRDSMPDDKFTLDLEDSDYKDDGYSYFQLKSKDLISFLNSYKSLRRTYVEEVIFEKERGKIKCVVVERNNEPSENEAVEMRGNGTYDAFMEKRISSQWMFDEPPLKPTVLPLINMTIEDSELVDIPKQYIKMIISNLLPNMENSTGAYGTMVFGENHVVIFNKAFNTVMNNFDPVNKIFSGMSLTYRFVNFINKVILANIEDDMDSVQVCKSDRFICIKSDSVESFINYSTKMTPYQALIDAYSKESFIELDRMYIKDVLKRFSLVHESIEVCIDVENNCLELKNTKFSQSVDYLSSKNIDSYAGLKFKIQPDILNSAIIGDDNSMIGVDEDGNLINTSVFLNICSGTTKERNIIFNDNSEVWFSLVRTRTY